MKIEPGNSVNSIGCYKILIVWTENCSGCFDKLKERLQHGYQDERFKEI